MCLWWSTTPTARLTCSGHWNWGRTWWCIRRPSTSGHGDITAGLVVGRKAMVDRIRLEGLKDMTGAVLSPHDASLLMRGIKTLALRMDRHCANALQVAQFLARQPQVELIHYPGLPSFAQYELAQRQMRLPGGMIAFELKGG